MYRQHEWLGQAAKDTAQFAVRFAAMGERAARWQAFAADPEGREVQASTEADGPIVARVLAWFMTPTPYCPPIQ
jgi:hypothetical protein